MNTPTIDPTDPVLISESSFDRISSSHQLQENPQRLTEYYMDWAKTYDKDVRREQYRGPAIVAEMAAMLQNAYLETDRRVLPVLDAGCGTGLVGLELAVRGFQHVDGCDLSSEMADIARNTGVYGCVYDGIDMNDWLRCYGDNQFSLVVCCGVFTLGHVQPKSLWELSRITKPGGIIIASTRKSYCDAVFFQDEVEALIKADRVNLVSLLRDGFYVADEGAHYWALQVPRDPDEGGVD